MPNNPIADPLVEGLDTDAVSQFVIVDATPEGLADVTINRPEQRNALNAEAIGALNSAFETLEGADGVRAVFLGGAGEAFSAGPDPQWLQDSTDYTEGELRQDAMALAVALKRLHDLPMLTIALVDGPAIGPGAGLAAACDFVIATERASFAFAEARHGLVAAVASPYLVAAVGAKRARGLLATARTLTAHEALAIGLVDEVVANVAGFAAARERIAAQASACAPGAVAEAKHVVAHVAGREIDHGLMEETARRGARARLGDEGREGAAAVLEGRPPAWSAA
jgi:methylglutaconyl-CoA hydratase